MWHMPEYAITQMMEMHNDVMTHAMSPADAKGAVSMFKVLASVDKALIKLKLGYFEKNVSFYNRAPSIDNFSSREKGDNLASHSLLNANQKL